MKEKLKRLRAAFARFARLFIILLVAAMILQFIMFSWLDKVVLGYSDSSYELTDTTTFGDTGGG